MSAPIPQFIDPTGGAGWPAWRDLVGRFVALVPTNYRTGVPKFGVKPDPATGAVPLTDEADFDMYVLDGTWPLLYGALADGTRPHTHRVDGPAKFVGCSSQHTNIVRALRKGWDGRQAIGTVLGVIQRSTVGSEASKPWNIESVENNDPRKALAAQIFGAVQAGTLHWAEPVELAPAAPAAPQYATMPAQLQQFAPQVAPFPQQAAPAFLVPPPAAAPAMPSFLQPAAPAAPVLAKPAQVDDATWAGLSDEQKQQAIAFFASVPPNTF